MLFVRSRCFRMKWVIEFDIVGLFDNINHGKLLELIGKHCQEKWIFPYIERCLKTPVLMPDKRLKRKKCKHTARRRHQSGVCKSFYALCIWRMDGREVSEMFVGKARFFLPGQKQQLCISCCLPYVILRQWFHQDKRQVRQECSHFFHDKRMNE